MTLPKGYDKDGDNRQKGNSKGKKIGIGVGIAIVLLIVVGIAASSSRNLQSSTSIGSENSSIAKGLNAKISFDRDPISRGSIQTITVSVYDGDKKLPGAQVSGVVTYSSGSTQKNFNDLTNGDGQVSYSWRIGGNSKTGTFGVDVTVSANGQTISKSSSFYVTTAS